MHIILVIVGAHAVVLGFGFAIAGWMSLVSPDAVELADLNARAEAARQRSWLRGQVAVWRWQQQLRSISKIVEHWRARPLARKLIYVGLGFLAAAGLVGYFLNVFA